MAALLIFKNLFMMISLQFSIQCQIEILVLAERSNLDHGDFHILVRFRIVQFVFGLLAVTGCGDVVSRLLIDLAVDAADTPDIGVLTLLHHDAISHNDIILFRINHQCASAFQSHGVLLQNLLAGVVSFNTAADQATGYSTESRVAVRQYSTANAAQQSSAGMRGFGLHLFNRFDRSVLE